MREFRFFLIAIIVILVSLGCSNPTGNPIPVMPGDLVISGESAPAVQQGNRQLWGIWDVYLDLETREVDCVPLRTANFKTNITAYMEQSLGDGHYISVMLWYVEEFPEYLGVELLVELEHPFPDAPALTGFDVKGIFMGNYSSVDTINSSLVYSTDIEESALLLNADGYTRWWNYTEFSGGSKPLFGYYPGVMGSPIPPTATLNPFMYFTDNIGQYSDLHYFYHYEDNVNTRGCFSPGASVKREYNLAFPKGDNGFNVRFQYAIDASWAPGDPADSGDPAEWDIPGDFPLEANQAGPFTVLCEPTYSNSIWGWFNPYLRVEVFSWEALADGGMIDIEKMSFSTYIDFDTIVINYEIEGPALDACRLPDFGTLISSVWEVEVPCSQAKEPGQFPVLVSVEPDPGGTYDQGFGQPAPSDPLAAYTIGYIDVNSGGGSGWQPDIAVTGWTQSVEVNEPVYFQFVDPYDQDHLISVDWDWDGDGEVDQSGPYYSWGEIIVHSWDVPGTYDVMAYGHVELWPYIVQLPAPIEIRVVTNCIENPVAVIDMLYQYSYSTNEDIEFDVTGSLGTGPLYFDWDWDDGHGWSETTSGAQLVTHIYYIPGIYNIMVRCKNGCGEDLLDEPIIVEVEY